MRPLLAVLLGLAVLAGGCLGDDGASSVEEASPGDDAPDSGEETGAVPSSTQGDTPWDGGEHLTIVDSEQQLPAFEADVLCTFGGGPRQPRSNNPIAQGADHLEVQVEVAPTYTGLQVGYTVDGNGADHEKDVNTSITWLPVVPGGQTETFEVPVPPGQVEWRNGMDLGTRWDFYERLQPPRGGGDMCYTGAGAGEMHILVTAVRAGDGVAAAGAGG